MVYSMDGKVNLHIDLKSLSLKNISLVLFIWYFFILF